MSDTIIVGVLALIGTIIGSYMTGNKTTAVMQEQIKVLSERVSKHNNLIERQYKTESDIKTVFIEVDEIKADVEELKNQL